MFYVYSNTFHHFDDAVAITQYHN